MGRRILSRVHNSRSKHDRVQQRSAPHHRHRLIDLQRSIGSRGVQRLINSPYIQAKLQVSTPDDQLEDEAEKTSDAVMRSTDSGNTKGITSSPRSNQTENNFASQNLQHRLTSSSSSSSLPNTVREFMEPRLGADLSGVKVHTGRDAADMTDQLHAQAFTYGQDIYFGAGKSPGKDALTAHELVHVVQQTDAGHASGINKQLVSRAPDEEKKKAEERSYWFQSKPPQPPTKTKSGIEITPKGQVVLDPRPQNIETEVGTIQVQFAGMDSDFQNATPTPAFASAEKAVLDAVAGAVADLGALPDIKGAESMKAAKAQRRQDEIARARLKEAARTLSGKTLNIFIASDLSVAEKISKAPLGLRTEQIFVRPGDIGDPKKLEGAIRIPLIALTGGVKGLAPGPEGQIQETSVQAMTGEQAKEALLHELVHVMLFNKGASAVQVWQSAVANLVSGPPEVKSLAEDVLFRYLRAQEEIFVYSAIGEVYSSFKANKDYYELLVAAVEAFLKKIGASVDLQKPINIDVKEKIGVKQKESVTWSITYKLPKAVKVDKGHLETLKLLQEMDVGS